MAPRKIQTYTSKSKFSRFNVSPDKSGKTSRRRNRTPYLDLSSRVGRLFEGSLEISLEDTFDKLKRGRIYNLVNFKGQNNIASFCKSNSVSNKETSSKNKKHIVKIEKSTPSYDQLSLETDSLKENRNEPDRFVMPYKKEEQPTQISFNISSETTSYSFCMHPLYYSTPVSISTDKTLPEKQQDSLKLNTSKDFVQCTPPRRNFVTKRRKFLLFNKIKNYSHNSQEKSHGSIPQHLHSGDKSKPSTRNTPKLEYSGFSHKQVSEDAQSKTSIKAIDLDYDNPSSKELFSEYVPSVCVTKNTSEMECGNSISHNHTSLDVQSDNSIKTSPKVGCSDDLEYDNSASKELFEEYVPSVSATENTSEMECGNSISHNHTSLDVQSDKSIKTSPKVECGADILHQSPECPQSKTSMTTVTTPISETVHLDPGPSSAHIISPKESLIIDLTDDVDDYKPSTFHLPSRMSKPGKSWRRWLHKDSPGEEMTNFKRRSRRSTLKIVPLVSQQPIKAELDTIYESLGNISLEAPEDEIPENPLATRDCVLLKCGQKEPESFEVVYNERTLTNCTKIGEGTFGEVFCFNISSKEPCVMKVMPIEGDQLVNGEEQKKFCEVLSEISIAKALSNLRENATNFTDAFNEVYRVRCVQGVYPPILLKQWEIFDQKKCSENDHPCMFQPDQLYIVLELRNGGKSLEDYQFQNSTQSYYMFQQIAFALAVAENVLKFEHRDLHWGNILLAEESANQRVKFELNGINCCIPSKGVRATIIDFTLSRVEFEQIVIFNDLAKDHELFEGDAKVDYQFDIYRLMKEKNGNDWQKFEPYTNLLWLHYLLDKVIHSVKYLRKSSSAHKTHMNKLKALKDEILSYDSVTNFVISKFTPSNAQA